MGDDQLSLRARKVFLCHCVDLSSQLHTVLFSRQKSDAGKVNIGCSDHVSNQLIGSYLRTTCFDRELSYHYFCGLVPFVIAV